MVGYDGHLSLVVVGQGLDEKAVRRRIAAAKTAGARSFFAPIRRKRMGQPRPKVAPRYLVLRRRVRINLPNRLLLV